MPFDSRIVLCSTTTFEVPSISCRNQPPLPYPYAGGVPSPQRDPPMSQNRLLLMWMFLPCWLGQRLSHPRMLTPDVECFTTLFVNSTFSTIDQALLPSWFRGVKRMANPFWSSAQLFSSTLQ